MTSAATGQIERLLFQNAEVRPQERQLLVDGHNVALGARAFDVLAHLIGHRDRVVTKSELMDAVWPHAIVEENNLHVQISTLRRLLGPAAITTIPGRGYQFTAPVESVVESGARAREPGHDDRGTVAESRPDAPASIPSVPMQSSVPAPPKSKRRLTAALLMVLGLAAIINFGITHLSHTPSIQSRGGPGSAPAHSVAVLPFVNMSGDATQDYFSDGLSEELLNSLGSVPELHVAARTSSFGFRDRTTPIPEIGRALNVGAILEGSVRRDASRVRITATLVDARSGYTIWSQSYDRDLNHILDLQTDVARSVTDALQVALLSDTIATIGQGATSDPAAFDAYLRGERDAGVATDEATVRAQLQAYEEAIRRDPGFANAYIGRARALVNFGRSGFENVAAVQRAFADARASAETAVHLAPDSGRAHATLGRVLAVGFFDYQHAMAEYDRALALAPGDALVLREAAILVVMTGDSERAVEIARQSVALDPLNVYSHRDAGWTYLNARRYADALTEYDRAYSLNPNVDALSAQRGLAFLATGNLQAARESCERGPSTYFVNAMCLAIVLQKLNLREDAQRQLAAMVSLLHDNAAYQLVEVHAQWGDTAQALDWLDTAYRLHDPGLNQMRTDFLVDPLRREKRFLDIEQRLKFPG